MCCLSIKVKRTKLIQHKRKNEDGEEAVTGKIVREGIKINESV